MLVITVSEVEAFRPGLDPGRAQAMIDGAVARATLIAPCIGAFEFGGPAEVAARSIIVGAIARWADVGNGAITQQTAGPFSQTIDTTQAVRNLFTRQEVAELRALCGGSPAAYTIDQTPGASITNGLYGAVVNGPSGWAPGEAG